MSIQLALARLYKCCGPFLSVLWNDSQIYSQCLRKCYGIAFVGTLTACKRSPQRPYRRFAVTTICVLPAMPAHNLHIAPCRERQERVHPCVH